MIKNSGGAVEVLAGKSGEQEEIVPQVNPEHRAA